MSRDHSAYPPVTGGSSSTNTTGWDATTHDHPYGPLPPHHLDGLNQYPGPIPHHHHHHDAHHSGLHLSTSAIDHNALGDAFLRQEFLASSLSPTNTSTVPTSPMTTGPPNGSSSSTADFFGMLGTDTNASSTTGAGDEIISAAIEEDKRRRNTAASARFRMKKKEREADLERRTRDMTERCEELQKRISALETENRWLRELITERSRNRGRVRRTSPKSEKADGKGGDKGAVTATAVKDKFGAGLRTK